MLKFYRVFLLTIATLGINQSAYSFDLKSLTDKIQKDIGGKVQIPKGNNNNPLGGMLKGLNQNKGSNVGSALALGGNTPNKNSSTKLAKGICEPNIPQTIKNLPKGNIALLVNDFGKNENEIVEIINKIPKSSDDPYVSSLKTFDGAFETIEIETIFNNFIRTKRYA